MVFFADFPPRSPATRFLGGTTVPPSADGKVHDASFEIEVGCAFNNLDPSLTTHRIHLLLADRAIDRVAHDPRTLEEPGHLVEASWILLESCQ
jgi:hypothetical protein